MSIVKVVLSRFFDHVHINDPTILAPVDIEMHSKMFDAHPVLLQFTADNISRPSTPAGLAIRLDILTRTAQKLLTLGVVADPVNRAVELAGLAFWAEHRRPKNVGDEGGPEQTGEDHG